MKNLHVQAELCNQQFHNKRMVLLTYLADESDIGFELLPL